MADIKGVIALLERRIAKVEARMTGRVEADPELAAIDQRLRTAPGAGPIVTAALIAALPELGQLDRRGIAALGGRRSGPRSIGGGRAAVPRSAIRRPSGHSHSAGPLGYAAFRVAGVHIGS